MTFHLVGIADVLEICLWKTGAIKWQIYPSSKHLCHQNDLLWHDHNNMYFEICGCVSFPFLTLVVKDLQSHGAIVPFEFSYPTKPLGQYVAFSITLR